MRVYLCVFYVFLFMVVLLLFALSGYLYTSHTLAIKSQTWSIYLEMQKEIRRCWLQRLDLQLAQMNMEREEWSHGLSQIKYFWSKHRWQMVLLTDEPTPPPPWLFPSLPLSFFQRTSCCSVVPENSRLHIALRTYSACWQTDWFLGHTASPAYHQLHLAGFVLLAWKQTK